MKIIAFGAHPTDIFADFGGGLKKNVLRGDTVYPIALSYGIDIHTETIGELGEEKVKEIRTKEMVEASEFMGFALPKILGLDPVRSAIPQQINWDMGLFPDFRISDVVEIIRELKPDIVVTHNPEDENEHGVTCKAVTRSCQLARYGHIKTKNPPHQIKSLYWNFDNCPLFCNRAKPYIDTFSEDYILDYDVIDVTETIELKAKSAAIFKTRGITYEQLANLYRCEARRFANFVTPEYVEVYKRVRRLPLFCFE